MADTPAGYRRFLPGFHAYSFFAQHNRVKIIAGFEFGVDYARRGFDIYGIKLQEHRVGMRFAIQTFHRIGDDKKIRFGKEYFPGMGCGGIGFYNCFTGAFVFDFSAVYAFKKSFGVFKFIIVSKEAFDDFGITFVLFGSVLTVAVHQYCIVIAGRFGVSTEW